MSSASYRIPVEFILITIVALLSFSSMLIRQYNQNATHPIESANHQFRKRHDYAKVQEDANYPVCKIINSLDTLLKEEELHKSKYNEIYKNMMLEGELNCGIIRVGGGIFDRRHNVHWTSCIHEIIDGKRRLLTYMSELCIDQQNANNKNNLKGLEQLDSPSLPATRGIIFTGTILHLRDIYQSISALRMLNVSLPVEVWISRQEHYLCDRTVGLLSNTDCKLLPSHVTGFASKFYALLGTGLTDVLFMDADNVAVRDVNVIFDSEDYRRTGAVLWPDLWGERCRLVRNIDAGSSAYRNHVLWTAGFGGMSWCMQREKAQEAEAGQLAINLRRHAGLLLMGRKFIEDTKFLKKIVNGDKDIFRLIFLLMGEPFHFVPHFPGYSFGNAQRDCLVHFFGHGDGTPFFFHQLKTRDPSAFKTILRLPRSMWGDPSACIDISVPWEQESAPVIGRRSMMDHSSATSSQASRSPTDLEQLQVERKLLASGASRRQKNKLLRAAVLAADSSTPLSPLPQSGSHSNSHSHSRAKNSTAVKSYTPKTRSALALVNVTLAKSISVCPATTPSSMYAKSDFTVEALNPRVRGLVIQPPSLEAESLVTFAEQLFKRVDSEWAVLDQQLYWSRIAYAVKKETSILFG